VTHGSRLYKTRYLVRVLPHMSKRHYTVFLMDNPNVYGDNQKTNIYREGKTSYIGSRHFSHFRLVLYPPQITLPNKLPLFVNFLLFMAIEVILTNKLTIVSFNLRLFQINTKSIPHFLSMILHNDFTVTFVLLTFANVFLTTSKAGIRWGISVYAFHFQMFIGSMLRWNHVLTDSGWNFVMESIMIIVVMIYTLLLGRLFQRMASKICLLASHSDSFSIIQSRYRHLTFMI
jgi:hypothetical protein